MGAPRSILVPIDGSPPSLAALDHAVALAEDGDTRIDVLEVEAPAEANVRSASVLPPDERVQFAHALDDAIERAQVRLGDRVTRRHVMGDPLRVIIATAGAGEYDLIVIGTHGRIGRLHALMGSVAEAVVRNAPCPVLTVREPGGGYQSFAERRHWRPSIADESSPHH